VLCAEEVTAASTATRGYDAATKTTFTRYDSQRPTKTYKS